MAAPVDPWEGKCQVNGEFQRETSLYSSGHLSVGCLLQGARSNHGIPFFFASVGQGPVALRTEDEISEYQSPFVTKGRLDGFGGKSPPPACCTHGPYGRQMGTESRWSVRGLSSRFQPLRKGA